MGTDYTIMDAKKYSLERAINIISYNRNSDNTLTSSEVIMEAREIFNYITEEK